MRITCPNCSAHYEIADGAIPDEGRDVQCSNCGTTWFQDGRQRALSVPESQSVPSVTQVERETPQGAEPAPAAPPPPPEAKEVDTGQATSPPAPGRRRRVIPDEQTLEILREEREHDARRKIAPGKAEPDSVKMDGAAESAAVRRRAAAERARLSAAAAVGRTGSTPIAPAGLPIEGMDVSEAVAETMRAARQDNAKASGGADESEDGGRANVPRRELLPDIEEINSSLRPDERVAEMASQDDAVQTDEGFVRRRSGFRTGFLVVQLMFVAAVAIYMFSDAIAARIPEFRPALDGYVAWVDIQRVGLAGSVESLTERLSQN